MKKHIFPAVLITTIFTSPAICVSAETETETLPECTTVVACEPDQQMVCKEVAGCANIVCSCLDAIVATKSCTTDADCGTQSILCDINGICTYTFYACASNICLAIRQSLYACGNGFYGTCTNNTDSSTCNCAECPGEGTSPTPEKPTLYTDYVGASDISSCYLPAGTYTDTVGGFTISAPCPHD